MDEFPINGMVDYVLDLKSDVKKSNWSTVMIFPWCGKDIVWNTVDGIAFMA